MKEQTPNINRILRRTPVGCARGAPLGARSFNYADSPLYLQRVNFVDGDYAPDGTYWGGNSKSGDLWCAFNGEDEDFAAASGTRIYVRAHSRAGAKMEIFKHYSGIKFKR